MFNKDYLEKIKSEKEKWDKIYEGQKERDVKFVTDSEIPIKQLYTPLDVKDKEVQFLKRNKILRASDKDYLSDISFPGVPPYTRGVYPSMYRGRLWTMRLFSGHGKNISI